MKMLDFKEKNFIILLFLLIGIIGLFIYYLNNRINVLENSISRQNEILNNFITNVRDNLNEDITSGVVSGSSIELSGPPSKDASELAKVSAENYLNNPEQKINVSDDSQSEDDSSDYESDYETDSDNENDNENNNENILKNINLNIENLDAGETKILDIISDKQKNNEIKTIEIEHLNDSNFIKPLLNQLTSENVNDDNNSNISEVSEVSNVSDVSDVSNSNEIKNEPTLEILNDAEIVGGLIIGIVKTSTHPAASVTKKS
mgnify:CR=1 FL=1